MKNKFTILGSGSSLGSPWITNYSAKLKKNHLLNPIIPNATNKVLSIMNYSNKNIKIDKINEDNLLNHDKHLDNIEILFNKIENDN